MSKEVFAQTLISKITSAIGSKGESFNAGSASLAMTAIAQGITEYLLANTTITIAYAGVLPTFPPSPDPMVSDTFKLVGTCAPTGASPSFDGWIRQIETNIMTGFQLAPSGTLGIVTAGIPFIFPGISITQGSIKSAVESTTGNPQSKVWEAICGSILDWANNFAANPAPMTASNPKAGSVGTAQITKIVVT